MTATTALSGCPLMASIILVFAISLAPISPQPIFCLIVIFASSLLKFLRKNGALRAHGLSSTGVESAYDTVDRGRRFGQPAVPLQSPRLFPVSLPRCQRG